MRSSSLVLDGLRQRRFLTQALKADAAIAIRRYEDGTGGAIPGADVIFARAAVDDLGEVTPRVAQAVLVQVRERLRQLVRDSDLLVRCGWDGFLVVARGSSRGYAEELVDRVRDAVAGRSFALPDGSGLARTCSIGFACFPFLTAVPREVPWPDVVEVAELGLQAARRTGRNGWVGIAAAAGPVRIPGLFSRLKDCPGECLEKGEVQLRSSLPLDSVTAVLAGREPGAEA